MSLDILTPRGRTTAEQQVEAINAVLANRPGSTFIHTALDGSASVDGFFVRCGEIRAVAEVKCRMNMDVAKFFGEFKGEWLITEQKISDMQFLCSILNVPGYGILYIVPSDIVLMRKLVNEDGRPVEVFRSDKTKTQRTVNGGTAERFNAFIPMHEALRIPVQKLKTQNS